jgi:hypothetical protein
VHKGYPAPRAPRNRAELEAIMGRGDPNHPWHPSIRGCLVTVLVYPRRWWGFDVVELPR